MQLLAPRLLNMPIDLHQPMLDHLARLRTVFDQISQLQKLSQTNHFVTNIDFLHVTSVSAGGCHVRQSY